MIWTLVYFSIALLYFGATGVSLDIAEPRYWAGIVGAWLAGIVIEKFYDAVKQR